jgi:hypothetical protein
MKIKLNFDTEKITNFIKTNIKYLPVLIVGSIFVIFAFLTYFALYPRADADHIQEGETRVQTLDIRFNTKLLNELSATKTPALLGTAGGRDPFSGF